MAFNLSMLCLLISAVVCVTDAPVICKQQSKEKARVGQNYTLCLDHSRKQCSEDCSLMLMKNDNDFYTWYTNVHYLIKDQSRSSEETENLKKRISASDLKENPINFTFSPVEMTDQGLYCLEHNGNNLTCVDLEVWNTSSSDTDTRNGVFVFCTNNANLCIGLGVGLVIAIAIAVIAVIVYFQRKRKRRNERSIRRNAVNEQNDVEMQELTGPQDEDRGQNFQHGNNDN